MFFFHPPSWVGRFYKSISPTNKPSPKTHMSPELGTILKGNSIFQPLMFRGYVSFQRVFSFPGCSFLVMDVELVVHVTPASWERPIGSPRLPNTLGGGIRTPKNYPKRPEKTRYLEDWGSTEVIFIYQDSKLLHIFMSWNAMYDVSASEEFLEKMYSSGRLNQHVSQALGCCLGII